MKRQYLHLIFTLCFVSLLTSTLFAAKPPLNLSDTTWQFDAKFAANIKKIDKTKLTGETDLVFGPSDAPVLAANEFLLTDPEGDTLTGTYLTDARKTILTPTSASITIYLTTKILAGADTADLTVTVNSITIKSTKAAAKPKSTKTGLALTTTLKIKATADLTVDGQPLVVKLTVSLKGKGENPLTVEGSQWEVPVRVKSGAIDTDEDDILEVFFGPNVDEGLAANEYKVITFDLDEFTGTYTVTKNSKVTMILDHEQFEELIAELLEENLEGGGATALEVNITKSAGTAKIKHAFTIDLKIKMNFNGEVALAGEVDSGSGNLSIKGKGTPLADD